MYKAFQDLRINDAVYEWNHGRLRYSDISNFKREFLIYKWRVTSVIELTDKITISLNCPFDGVQKTVTFNKDDKVTSMERVYFSDLSCLIDELLKGLEEVKKHSLNRFKGSNLYHQLNKDGDDIRQMMCIIRKLDYRMFNTKTKYDHLFRPYTDGTTLKVNLIDLR